jgi:hypothetical protein
VHAIGTPLITNSDGTKFGKSEGNAIWLDAEMCSPYRMYQFWLNTDDADVVERLKIFTFLTRAEIEQYEETVAAEPFRRAAQKRLALEVTTTVHGPEATAAVIAASEALFGAGDLGALDAATLRSALEELPHATIGAPRSRRHWWRRDCVRASARRADRSRRAASASTGPRSMTSPPPSRGRCPAGRGAPPRQEDARRALRRTCGLTRLDTAPEAACRSLSRTPWWRCRSCARRCFRRRSRSAR